MNSLDLISRSGQVRWASEAAEIPFSHWVHELGLLGPELHLVEAELVRDLLAGLRDPGEQLALSFYPVSADVSDRALGSPPTLAKAFRRGVFKCRAVDWVVGVVEPTPESVQLSWLNGGNDTTLWAIGDGQTIVEALEKTYVDDVEANPVNEMSILGVAAATVVSRGWDGVTLRVYSRRWGTQRFGELLAALATLHGWSLAPLK